jgi:hypothetical protein
MRGRPAGAGSVWVSGSPILVRSAIAIPDACRIGAAGAQILPANAAIRVTRSG